VPLPRRAPLPVQPAAPAQRDMRVCPPITPFPVGLVLPKHRHPRRACRHACLINVAHSSSGARHRRWLNTCPRCATSRGENGGSSTPHLPPYVSITPPAHPSFVRVSNVLPIRAIARAVRAHRACRSHVSTRNVACAVTHVPCTLFSGLCAMSRGNKMFFLGSLTLINLCN
jgi:hypothetical protein